MKRYGDLFEKAFCEENLYAAYIDARRGKRSKRACFEFEKNLGENLAEIYQELHCGNYSPEPYFQFIIYEPKQRLIHAPSFRDVVVQHAIYRIVYQIFNRSFIDQSFACRKGYGTHRAAKYSRRVMQACYRDEYVLKLDIRKFFYSIDREILRSLIERKIKDTRLVDIMLMFADMKTPLGIPIGNLLSQIYALIYLNPLDHFIKRVLKIRNYVRYVDDSMLIGLPRGECLALRKVIIEFLRQHLNLELSRSSIQKIQRGVNFCGYRMWQTRVFIRKYSLYKFRKMIKKEQQESVNSLLGHAKGTNSLTSMLKKLKEVIRNGQNLQVPKSYRRIYDSLPG